MEGYEKTDNVGFNKITGDNVADIEAVAENFEIADENIGDIKRTNLQGYDDGEHGEKSAANFIKFIWSKLGSIELTDIKVKVTTWANDPLNIVLGKIKDWIGTMGQLKTREKESLVGAVNEVHNGVEILRQAEILDRQDINAIKSELTGEDEALRQNNEKFAQLLGVDIEEVRGGVG